MFSKIDISILLRKCTNLQTQRDFLFPAHMHEPPKQHGQKVTPQITRKDQTIGRTVEFQRRHIYLFFCACARTSKLNKMRIPVFWHNQDNRNRVNINYPFNSENRPESITQRTLQSSASHLHAMRLSKCTLQNSSRLLHACGIQNAFSKALLASNTFCGGKNTLYKDLQASYTLSGCLNSLSERHKAF